MQYLKKNISSSYTKILGETNFQPREFPRSGSKAKDVKEKEERKGPKVGNNNGKLLIANTTSGGARKAPGPIFCFGLLV